MWFSQSVSGCFQNFIIFHSLRALNTKICFSFTSLVFETVERSTVSMFFIILALFSFLFKTDQNNYQNTYRFVDLRKELSFVARFFYSGTRSDSKFHILSDFLCLFFNLYSSFRLMRLFVDSKNNKMKESEMKINKQKLCVFIDLGIYRFVKLIR